MLVIMNNADASATDSVNINVNSQFGADEKLIDDRTSPSIGQ